MMLLHTGPCLPASLPSPLFSLGVWEENSLNAFRGFPPGEGVESDSHWAGGTGAPLGVISCWMESQRGEVTQSRHTASDLQSGSQCPSRNPQALLPKKSWSNSAGTSDWPRPRPPSAHRAAPRPFATWLPPRGSAETPRVDMSF